jgi:hypothetical protein
MADRSENAQWIAQQAAAVAKSWFRVVEIPEEAHPALLAEYAKGPPSRDRFMGIAREWQAKEQAKDLRRFLCLAESATDEEVDRHIEEARKEKGLPPLPKPGPTTVADLAVEIGTLRQEWMSEPNDRDNLFWAPFRLGRLWDKARQIPNTSPPPALTIPAKGPVNDMQAALGALDDLLRWCEPARSDKPAAASSKAKAADKRSWTQPDLDAAIGAEIEKYSEMIAAAKKGKTIAKQFGRNALANRLGVKSPRMVSLSQPWLELADSLGLSRKSRRRGKVGLEIALEQKADADDSNVAATAVHRETTAILEKAIADAKDQRKRRNFEAIRDKFALGEMTDEQAREAVALLQDG